MRFSDASKWQHEHYDRIHAPRGQSNILHFHYTCFGARLEERVDYRPGFYSLVVTNADIRWFAELTRDEDDEASAKKAFNGRFIFFEGRNGPIQGFKLVSSPWTFRESKLQDPKGARTTVLKTFSRVAASMYLLNEMSPDGRYGLVTAMESARTKSGETGWANTYYLVDTSSGKTRVLLKDRVAQETHGFMSPIWWVRGSQ